MTAPKVGDVCGTVERSASSADLFRFSAVTWNAHRIHLDPAWARQESLPGAVVQAHLHGAWFAQVACSIAGPTARLRALSWQNKAPVVADEVVALGGEVVAVDEAASGWHLQLALQERKGDAVTADASATVFVPKEAVTS